MKRLAAIIVAFAALAVRAATNPIATQLWTTNKIDAIVGTNTAARIAAATNATLTAAKSYTDQAVVAAGAVTPGIATNIAGRVTSNVVTKAYVEGLGIEAGISELTATGIAQAVVAPFATTQAQHTATLARALVGEYNIGTKSVLFPSFTMNGGTTLDMLNGSRINVGRMDYGAITVGAEENGIPAIEIVHRGPYEQNVGDYIKIGGTNVIDAINARTTPLVVTNIVRSVNGGVWDAALQVWWTPKMSNGKLTYQATTNINLTVGN